MNVAIFFGCVISVLLAVVAAVITVAACAFFSLAWLYIGLAELLRSITGRNESVDLPDDRHFVSSTRIARAARRKAAAARAQN